MDAVMLVLRLVLAGVFLFAGLAKLADRTGSLRALVAFGVPTRLAPTVGAALPAVEMIAAALLLPATTTVIGAALVGVLLLTFLVGMIRTLRRGERPDCHCFGQIHSEPVGVRSIVRNAGLLAVAVLIAVASINGADPSPVIIVDDLSGVELALLAALGMAFLCIGTEAWLMRRILGQNGRVLMRMERIEAGLGSNPSDRDDGLPVGTLVPDVRGMTLSQAPISVHGMLERGRPALMVFIDPACEPCAEFRPTIRRWQTRLANWLTVIVVSRGDIETNRGFVGQHQLQNVLVQHELSVSDAFKMLGSPAGVLISGDGRIASKVGRGATAIEDLVNEASRAQRSSIVEPPLERQYAAS